jgi:hypothetical protein
LRYIPFRPTEILIEAESKGCRLTGTADWKARTIRLTLTDRSQCRTGQWLRAFKKGEKGAYEYVGGF